MESQYDEIYREEAVEAESPAQEVVVVESSEPKKNNMAMASMIMGILSLVLGCCCMGSIFGGLAVLFACLSRTEGKFDTKARAGLIMGIIGILLTIVIFIVTMLMGTMDTTQWFEMVKAAVQIKGLA